MRIDIFSDVICPWCFIGKRRLEKALALRPQAEPKVHWRAFQLNPGMPAEGMERSAYLAAKFGGPEAAQRIYDTVRAAGQRSGVDFAFDRIRRTPNTVAAHRLIRFADRFGRQDATVEALFRAYFLGGRLIGTVDALVEIAAEAGLDVHAARAFLQSDEETEAVLAEDVHARQLGIGGVPCFIVDGRYALSGAQEPEAFLPVFDLVAAEAPEPTSASVS
ncbi:MAG: DsbA family oxidoreductase [Alphaproteobacteria bacterium]|nr:DsbA family oxidoreductase [Alphaproteobacteria bacterium]